MTGGSVDPVPSAVTEAPAHIAPAGVAPAEHAVAHLQILGGDEIIELLIRPSPCCIALYAFKPVLALGLLAAAAIIAAQGQPSLPTAVGLVLIVLAGITSVIVATLLWASQLYVLTNRRVLAFHGVFTVAVKQRALKEIAEARLHARWYQPPLRLGSIHLLPTAADQPVLAWDNIARPADIHGIVARAIQKAKSGP